MFNREQVLKYFCWLTEQLEREMDQISPFMTKSQMSSLLPKNPFDTNGGAIVTLKKSTDGYFIFNLEHLRLFASEFSFPILSLSKSRVKLLRRY